MEDFRQYLLSVCHITALEKFTNPGLRKIFMKIPDAKKRATVTFKFQKTTIINGQAWLHYHLQNNIFLIHG